MTEDINPSCVPLVCHFIRQGERHLPPLASEQLLSPATWCHLWWSPATSQGSFNSLTQQKTQQKSGYFLQGQ